MARKRMLTLNGKSQCLKEWALSRGMTPSLLKVRLKKGIPLERALEMPVKEYVRQTTGYPVCGALNTWLCKAKPRVEVSDGT